MGGGPDTVTTTTNTEPPAFLRGPLTTAVNAAQSQFNQATGGQFGPAGFGGGFGGGRIPGFPGGRNPTTGGPGLPGTAGQGAAGVEAATGVPGAGGFDPMPFLTNSFNRAADLTRGRLDTEFSGAGRNLGASIPARSQELQDLANQFFDPSNLFEFDPTNVLINRLAAIIPNAGGTTTSQQPVFKQGLFGF
jgi:hypothetical protein